MRHISKRAQIPSKFKEWLDQANQDWQPTWAGLSGEPKEDLDDSLLAEQGHICCYCGWRVGVIESDHHIEHVVPGRSATDPGALDYRNLLISCGPVWQDAREQPIRSGPRHLQHCGGHRGETPLPISPLLVDCTDYFIYTDDGRVIPSHRNRELAQQTIDILNLKADWLSRRRAAAIQALEGLSVVELQRLRSRCNQIIDGFLSEFCFVVANVASARLERNSG